MREYFWPHTVHDHSFALLDKHFEEKTNRRIVDHMFRHYSTLHILSDADKKSLTRFIHPFPHFNIVFIYYCPCSHPQYN